MDKKQITKAIATIDGLLNTLQALHDAAAERDPKTKEYAKVQEFVSVLIKGIKTANNNTPAKVSNGFTPLKMTISKVAYPIPEDEQDEQIAYIHDMPQ